MVNCMLCKFYLNKNKLKELPERGLKTYICPFPTQFPLNDCKRIFSMGVNSQQKAQKMKPWQ